MGERSEWHYYPFGILQKTYVQLCIYFEHIEDKVCANPDCFIILKSNSIWCSDKCYEHYKFERQVAGTWIE